MLYFVDRSKNIIRRSGENVAAAEVEAVLQSAPWVEAGRGCRLPDEVREAEVLACVVPRAGIRIDAALARDLHDWAAERLAYYKAPGWVLFSDACRPRERRRSRSIRYSSGARIRARAPASTICAT